LQLGKGSTDAGVMSMRSYFWHQAQLCMALARGANDPVLKQRYEDLALDLAQNAGSERDLDMTVPPLSILKYRNSDSGDNSPHG
jgi:hypothetical protein